MSNQVDFFKYISQKMLTLLTQNVRHLTKLEVAYLGLA
jgi:hypothetical protein